MVDISRKTYGRNVIETIVDNDRILWSNEKHIDEGLDHKILQQITTKYHPDKKEPKKQSNKYLETKIYQSE